jgi:CTP:molybdopterin cytidylyltransferase MocA
MSVAGALLAAGGSRRLGRPKALVESRGLTLVRRAALELAAVCSPLLVVAPPKAGAIALELEGLGARLVVNRLPARGMGSSIATAARALATIAPEAQALLVALVDQPLVDRALLARLIDAAGRDGWAACDYGDGVIGPPALFPRAAFAAVAALSGDRGARELLLAARDRLALVPFPGGVVDVDTLADYERLAASDGAGSGPPLPRA